LYISFVKHNPRFSFGKEPVHAGWGPRLEREYGINLSHPNDKGIDLIKESARVDFLMLMATRERRVREFYDAWLEELE
jgi:hypothetical protein